MRVFAVSDIHVDYPENALWVEQLSNSDYQNDCLILAGDISDSMERIGACFEILKRKFAHILFIPGNHELWVRSDESISSIEKCKRVIKVAHSFGVVTTPTSINNIYFLPVWGWYDFSFGKPSEYICNAWVDFRRCKWPESLNTEEKITQYFLAKNTLPTRSDQVVVSFSHFLPRIDVMPSFIPAERRQIYPVLGSEKLDRWVRDSGSRLHVYGHSHVNRDVTIEGVRYINNAFAYPNEDRISRKQLFELTIPGVSQ